MKTGRLLDCALSWVPCLALMVFLVCPSLDCHAAIEQTFALLRIGATTYRNVTVTTKSRDYVFILHSTGMTNLKVADLPADVRSQLGYDGSAATQAGTNSPAAWARQTLSRIEAPQVKQLQQQLAGWSRIESAKLSLPELSQKDFLILGAALLALYLFHCYCCLLICEKAGAKPGFLVWVPVLQLFPLLKAAAMKRSWFIAFLVPGLNVLAQIMLCLKLAEARGKTLLVGILLIFPLTSPLAALYLAFSGGRPRKKEVRRVEIMTLEAA